VVVIGPDLPEGGPLAQDRQRHGAAGVWGEIGAYAVLGERRTAIDLDGRTAG
jgi:hypothetical protein